MLEIGKRDGFKCVDVDGYAGHIDIGEGEETFGILGHLDVFAINNRELCIWSKSHFREWHFFKVIFYTSRTIFFITSKNNSCYDILQDVINLCKIPSVLDEGSADENQPFGQACRDALDAMLEIGKRDGFKCVDVDHYNKFYKK